MGDILWLVVTGSIGGWLAGYLSHRDRIFDLSDVIVGVLGSFVGGVILMFVPFLSGDSFIGGILMSMLGAVVLTWAYEKYQQGKLAG